MGPLNALPATVEQAAYRIVSEAVANAARHSRATRLEVRVEADDEGRLVVQVRDDGCGFDASDPPVRGIGLSSMRERARELGGRLVVDSSTEGTTVTLTVPALSTAGMPVG